MQKFSKVLGAEPHLIRPEHFGDSTSYEGRSGSYFSRPSMTELVGKGRCYAMTAPMDNPGLGKGG